MCTHLSAPNDTYLDTSHDQPLTDSNLRYWLGLLRAPGVGCSTFYSLLDQFNSPKEVFVAAKGRSLSQFLSKKTLDYLQNPDWGAVESDIRWLSREGNGALPLHDPGYPALLREIHDPPPVLFFCGEPRLLHHPQIAIVGSRNPSRNGSETALEFAKHLSEAGFAITSGLAIGIDTAAHQGALAARKLTVAVAGTGLDRVYPARNQALAREIAAHGLLVSEFPPGTPPVAGNFPRRNRIISGLCTGTLVVEAARQSGSLITARTAMEQGREVFAIPGSIHNPLARGCHALIRQGAKLVETADDIMEELSHWVRLIDIHQSTLRHNDTHNTGLSTTPGGETNQQHKTKEMNELLPTLEHQLLYAQLGYEPATIDMLVERSQLTTEAVSAMLVELELKGCVTSDSGLYTRSH